MKQMAEAISKYDIMGYKYVRLDELMALIRVMQHKHREAKEPGYMHQNNDQCIAADLALNHLCVILNKEEISVETMMRVMKTRIEREGKEQATEVEAKTFEEAEKAIEKAKSVIDRGEKLLAEMSKQDKPKVESKPKSESKPTKHCPGRYTVWYRDDGDTTQYCMGFVRFEKGIPVFTNRPCKATWFTWRGMAEKVAEKCGEGFEVVDMIDQMTAEERLLRAIFREDGMDGEDADDEVCEWHGDGVKAEDEDWDGDDDE